jgi:TM2 domain-containing membrane protein YozV
MSGKKAKTHPGVAAILSFIFSGLGQIYNGEIKKGLVYVAWATLGVVLILLGAVSTAICFYYGVLLKDLLIFSSVAIVVGGIVICWVGTVSIFDAYKVASDNDSRS